MQTSFLELLVGYDVSPKVEPLKLQLLKWVGNKQRFAPEIISYFPSTFNAYFEPFLGSGGVLGVLAPQKAVGSDNFAPLIDIWKTLKDNPSLLKSWYEKRYLQLISGEKKIEYEKIKASYNNKPNGADLVFLSRSCYGGVVRFRTDGYMSTPCGIHVPITPESFSKRVDIWNERVQGTTFLNADYAVAMAQAKEGDVIYCDPPYQDSQTILYGAQSFSLKHLFEIIAECKKRGVYVALSIDGTKKSGKKNIDLGIPKGLFEREVFVHVGRSMLKRFQMEGDSLENEVVKDRLLLTY
ncbi:MAG: Dam family site-specific DNA-(adenine-N6)-methyltransferase [Chloroflexi bacterium]|nr:Dam family site-specific DNA-(adenine-N6)-methyltransferase [Chloroflexota bacterium]